jgi:hypothetical protein
MKAKSSTRHRASLTYPAALGVLAADLPVSERPEPPEPRHSTGTIDDDDEPEDEHDGENEAAERATSDDTEAPEEFQRDDEDRP